MNEYYIISTLIQVYFIIGLVVLMVTYGLDDVDTPIAILIGIHIVAWPYLLWRHLTKND